MLAIIAEGHGSLPTWHINLTHNHLRIFCMQLSLQVYTIFTVDTALGSVHETLLMRISWERGKISNPLSHVAVSNSPYILHSGSAKPSPKEAIAMRIIVSHIQASPPTAEQQQQQQQKQQQQQQGLFSYA